MLHHGQHPRRAASGRRDVEAIRAETPNDAVVADEAVFAQQQTVAATARCQLGPGVGVHAVHELDRIGPHDFDLTERRGVEQTQRVSHLGAFPRHGRGHVLSRLREVPGAPPERHRLEHRPILLGPGIDEGLSRNLEKRVLAVAGEGPEGRRRVRWTERRQADLRRGPPQLIGRDGQAVHVRHLALIGRHAVGGEALDVLDRKHAFAHRQANVLRGHVILEIDEGPGRRAVGVGRHLLDDRTVARPVAGNGESNAGNFPLQRCQRGAGRRDPVVQRGLLPPKAASSAGDMAIFRRFPRQEDTGFLIPDQAALGMGEKL